MARQPQRAAAFVMPEKESRKRVDLVRLKMVRESSTLYEPRRIESPKAAADLFRQFIGDADREQMMVCCLDVRNQPTCLHVTSIGTLAAAAVHPREVFKTAVLANAASIIVGHNHPSGDCAPSREDIEVTSRLREAGRVLGIEVLDHVIVGGAAHVSLREQGIVA